MIIYLFFGALLEVQHKKNKTLEQRIKYLYNSVWGVHFELSYIYSCGFKSAVHQGPLRTE